MCNIVGGAIQCVVSIPHKENSLRYHARFWCPQPAVMKKRIVEKRQIKNEDVRLEGIPLFEGIGDPFDDSDESRMSPTRSSRRVLARNYAHSETKSSDERLLQNFGDNAGSTSMTRRLSQRQGSPGPRNYKPVCQMTDAELAAWYDKKQKGKTKQSPAKESKKEVTTTTKKVTTVVTSSKKVFSSSCFRSLKRPAADDRYDKAIAGDLDDEPLSALLPEPSLPSSSSTMPASPTRPKAPRRLQPTPVSQRFAGCKALQEKLTDEQQRASPATSRSSSRSTSMRLLENSTGPTKDFLPLCPFCGHSVTSASHRRQCTQRLQAENLADEIRCAAEDEREKKEHIQQKIQKKKQELEEVRRRKMELGEVRSKKKEFEEAWKKRQALDELRKENAKLMEENKKTKSPPASWWQPSFLERIQIDAQADVVPEDERTRDIGVDAADGERLVCLRCRLWCLDEFGHCIDCDKPAADPRFLPFTENDADDQGTLPGQSSSSTSYQDPRFEPFTANDEEPLPRQPKVAPKKHPLASPYNPATLTCPDE